MSNTIEAEPDHWRSTRKVITMGTRLISYVVYFYIMAVEAILFLGFLLLLLGANSSSSFVEWVYRSLDRAMKPFRGIFTPIELGTVSGSEVSSIFSTSIVFAMIVYAIIGLVVYSFIGWLAQRLDRIEREERDAQLAATADQLAYAAQVSAANMPASAAPAMPASAAPAMPAARPVPAAPATPATPTPPPPPSTPV